MPLWIRLMKLGHVEYSFFFFFPLVRAANHYDLLFLPLVLALFSSIQKKRPSPRSSGWITLCSYTVEPNLETRALALSPTFKFTLNELLFLSFPVSLFRSRVRSLSCFFSTHTFTIAIKITWAILFKCSSAPSQIRDEISFSLLAFCICLTNIHGSKDRSVLRHHLGLMKIIKVGTEKGVFYFSSPTI